MYRELFMKRVIYYNEVGMKKIFLVFLVALVFFLLPKKAHASCVISTLPQLFRQEHLVVARFTKEEVDCAQKTKKYFFSIEAPLWKKTESLFEIHQYFSCQYGFTNLVQHTIEIEPPGFSQINYDFSPDSLYILSMQRNNQQPNGYNISLSSSCGGVSYNSKVSSLLDLQVIGATLRFYFQPIFGVVTWVSILPLIFTAILLRSQHYLEKILLVITLSLTVLVSYFAIRYIKRKQLNNEITFSIKTLAKRILTGLVVLLCLVFISSFIYSQLAA